MPVPEHLEPWGGRDPPEADVFKREERTFVWREVRPDGERTVVKLYRHRGWMNGIRGRLLRFRAQREYHRLRHLVRWNIPCTVPLGWCHGRSKEHGRFEILVTREVPDAVQLGVYLRECAGQAALAPLYRIVRRMHESGFCHQTLFSQNVLVSPEAPAREAYFIADVPRSWTFPRSIVGTKLAYLDLLDLTVRIQEAGVDPASIPLDAYGLDPAGERWFDRRRATDPTTKGRRLLRDVRARTRWAGAWCQVGRGRVHPTREEELPERSTLQRSGTGQTQDRPSG